MNVPLCRKLGLMQAHLKELGELDAFSELSDLDYLSKLESRLKRTIAGLAEKGEVSENPLNTLEEHWKRATIFLRPLGELSKAWDNAFSDPSKKKTWTKEALLEAKANLSRLQSQLDEDFRKLRELFHADDWSGGGPPEPTLLAYESIVGEERNGLAKMFSKGLGLVIANLDKARTDYAAKGAQRKKVLDSLLEDFEKEQIALSEAEGEWTKGKVDQVEKILSGLSGHFELGGALRQCLDLRLASLDELQKLRAKARNLEAKTALPSNWEAFLVELDGIRRRSSGLPKPIVDGMALDDLKNTISTGLSKAREEEAKAERKRKRGRLFLCSFIIAAAGFAFYYFSILAPRIQAEEEAEQARMQAEEEGEQARMQAEEEGEQARMQAEEEAEQARMQAEAIKFLAERMKENFPVPSSGTEMLWVKPGAFPLVTHTVTLTEGYWLGKYEVTQAQWLKVVGSNPSRFKGANRPVEEVSWTDVTSFCEKLTELEREAGRLPAGMAYQLPTEAQWEYACRAGTTTDYAFGDRLTYGQANISGGPGKTTDVGKYPANGWGFHDMHGNAYEWCADWYGAYPNGAVSDPVGPADGSYRVLRGGSWDSTAYFARSANRNRSVPALSVNTLGFRLSLRPANQ
jgi:sulfatase modifying factor 1